MCQLRVKGNSNIAPSGFWYFGTWAMRQFYVIYRMNGLQPQVSIVDSVMKSVKVDPTRKKPPAPKPPKKSPIPLIIVMALAIMFGLCLVACCVQRACFDKTNKNKLFEKKEKETGKFSNFMGHKQIEVDISQTDRGDTIVSNTDLLKRYDTGGRTWVGQVKIADQRLFEQQKNLLSIQNEDDSQSSFVYHKQPQDNNRLSIVPAMLRGSDVRGSDVRNSDVEKRPGHSPLSTRRSTQGAFTVEHL